MTTEKAREFFSSYYEGNLEDGLKLSLDQALREDPGLREEYDLFAQTMKELDTLGEFEAPIPFDLHDRITARLEEADQKKVVPMLTIWRNVAVGLVAASLIFGAILSLKTKSSDVTSAGMGGDTPPVVKTVAPLRPTFNYSPAKGLTVEIQSERQVWLRVDTAPENAKIKQLDVQPGQQVVVPLTNANSEGAAFRVTLVGEPEEYYVALPGTTQPTTLTGEGTLLDMGLAMASHYKAPVLLTTSKIGAKARWDFTEKDAKAALAFALDSQKAVGDVKESGLISIQDR